MAELKVGRPSQTSRTGHESALMSMKKGALLDLLDLAGLHQDGPKRTRSLSSSSSSTRQSTETVIAFFLSSVFPFFRRYSSNIWRANHHVHSKSRAIATAIDQMQSNQDRATNTSKLYLYRIDQTSENEIESDADSHFFHPYLQSLSLWQIPKVSSFISFVAIAAIAIAIALGGGGWSWSISLVSATHYKLMSSRTNLFPLFSFMAYQYLVLSIATRGPIPADDDWCQLPFKLPT